MKERLIFHLDLNLENLLDYFNSLQACTQCMFVWWGMGLWARAEDTLPFRKTISNSSLKEIISQSD